MIKLTCMSKGCQNRAKLNVGWRAIPVGVPDAVATPLEAYTNVVVCRDHIPANVPEMLPPLEMARIDAFLKERANKMPLDWQNAKVLTRKLGHLAPMPTVMTPVISNLAQMPSPSTRLN